MEGNVRKINPQIISYWQQIFGLAGKGRLRECELVEAMLSYHRVEKNPTNETKCLGKIFKDEYRGYLVLNVGENKIYYINPKILQTKE